MAAISAADVAKLRRVTLAGMMDCKKALEELSKCIQTPPLIVTIFDRFAQRAKIGLADTAESTKSRSNLKFRGTLISSLRRPRNVY